MADIQICCDHMNDGGSAPSWRGTLKCYDECCTYDACVNWCTESGPGANCGDKENGVVYVTIDTENCPDDEYPACMKWTGGKYDMGVWEATIPDNCCNPLDDCEYCTECTTPPVITANFSGVTMATNCCGNSEKQLDSWLPNGEYEIDQWTDDCQWFLPIDLEGEIHTWQSFFCSEPTGCCDEDDGVHEKTIPSPIILITKYQLTPTARASVIVYWPWGNKCGLGCTWDYVAFSGTYRTADPGCIDGTCGNETSECEFLIAGPSIHGNVYYGKGGQCVISGDLN